MAGYTKLFSSIVYSTVWREKKHVKIVWITMLALSDKNGTVEASIPGLADAARVTIDECTDALDRLSSPDKYSRSKEHGGRRIEAVDGGWKLLNYIRYRGKLQADKIREQTRIRVAKHRERQCNATVTHNADLTRGNAQSDPTADPTAESDPSKSKEKYIKRKPTNQFELIEGDGEKACPKPKPSPYPPDFVDWYDGYPRKEGKDAALREWKKVKKHPAWPGLQAMIVELEAYKRSPNVLKGFKHKPSTYLKDGHWQNEITPEAPGSTQAAVRGERLTPLEQKKKRQQETIDRYRREEL